MRNNTPQWKQNEIAMERGDELMRVLTQQFPDKDDARWLISNGAALGMQNKNGATPLMMAQANGFYDLFELMLRNGAPPDQQNFAGNTALITATIQGKEACIDLLLRHDADVNIANNLGNTALMYACGNDKAETVRKLLAAGADPLHRNLKGQSVADTLAGNNDTAVRKLLDDAIQAKLQEICTAAIRIPESMSPTPPMRLRRPPRPQ